MPLSYACVFKEELTLVLIRIYKLAPGLLSPQLHQHSQNRQNLSTRVNNKTLAQQETFEQLSLEMSRKHKVAPYLDDSSLR